MNAPIWKSGLPLPEAASAPYPRGMTRILAHDGRADLLPFLNDCAMTVVGGRLVLAWYNSTDAEICGSSLIRGRISADEGDTWAEPFTLVGEVGVAEEHYVPVNLFVHAGKPHALITEMAGKNITVSLGLYRAEGDPAGPWKRLSTIAPGFICNTAPIPVNGGYMAGAWLPMREDTPAFPVVLFSQGQALEMPWRSVLLYDPLAPGAPAIRCPEVGLIADGQDVTAFVRGDTGRPGAPSGGPSHVFHSKDGGESWHGPLVNPLRPGNAKLAAGMLADGRRFLVYNDDRGFFNRTRLLLALGEAGEQQFSKVYRLFEDGLPEFGGRGHNWFYPCAIEHGGCLYVACTMEEQDKVRSAAVAKVPLAFL